MGCINFTGLTQLLIFASLILLPVFSGTLQAVAATEKASAVSGDTDFNFGKGNHEADHPSVPKVQIRDSKTKLGGRKIVGCREMEKLKVLSAEINRNRHMEASKMASVTNSVRNRRNTKGKDWKDAFTADYRSPKPHPPKNN